jgi:hypothetical protein
MTAKEGPSSFTLVSANISWPFVMLELNVEKSIVNSGKLFWQHVSSTNIKTSLFYSRLKRFRHQRAKF